MRNLLFIFFVTTKIFGQETGTVVMKGDTFPTIFKDGTEYVIIDSDTTKLIRETMPEFPGGQDGLIKFIQSELKYPKVARKNKIQGQVYVSFIINNQGLVDSLSISKSVNSELDNEAMRVIKQMPKWIPGTQDGKPVNVHFTFPINFRLQ